MVRTLEPLRDGCHRFGPGRLPAADRADIGAGYAAATAALAAILLWAAVWGSLFHVQGTDALAGAMLAGYAVVFVLPAAFIVGVVGWRVATPSTPVVGGLLGLVATAAVYALALGFVFVATVVLLALTPGGALTATAAVGAIGITTSWFITLPVGAVAGWTYTAVTNAD